VRKFLATKWAKVLVFLLALSPFLNLLWESFYHKLGPNPVEYLQHTTGDWTIRFLVLTLAVTPFRKTSNLPELIRFRRMLGLFAFFYLCQHFFTYLGPDQSFSVSGMLKDVVKRPFITVGFAAFLLLVPLALTSTQGWIRRLGGKRWRQLHRLIYVAAVLGVIHYWWLVKSDVRRPLFYGVLVVLLLFWRVWDSYRKRGSEMPARAAAPTAPGASVNG
jgi:sulfoxide reductase heme-binding subunit YedZ